MTNFSKIRRVLAVTILADKVNTNFTGHADNFISTVMVCNNMLSFTMVDKLMYIMGWELNEKIHYITII